MKADLLGTPALLHQLVYRSEQAAVLAVDATNMTPAAARDSVALGVKRPVVFSADRVPGDLAGDGRRRPPQQRGDRPHTLAGVKEISDLNTLVLGEISRADLADSQSLERGDEPKDRSATVGLVPA